MRRRDVLRTTVGALTVGGTSGRVAAQSNSFGPLGSVPVEGAREAVVSADGRTAYVAATDGFVTVDLADPRNPRVLAERRDLLADHPQRSLDGIHDVKVDGDRLLVVGPASGNYDGSRAMLVFDVSDPNAPKRSGVHYVGAPIHNGYLAGGVAYLAVVDGEANPLVMVDADTTNEIGRWSLPAHDERWADVPPAVRPLHDVYVRGGLAYVALWDAGTWVLDVRDPARVSVVANVGGRPPERLASSEIDSGVEFTEPPGNDHYSAVNDDGTLLGVGKESWNDPETPEGGPSGIDLWDVADLDAPRKLATIPPPPTPDPMRDGVWVHAHNFEFFDGRLYSSWFSGGVKVHDVSDPARPREIAAWRASSNGGFWTAERASFWTAQVGVPGSFFVASAWENHDGNNPSRLFTFPDPAATSPSTRANGSSDSPTNGSLPSGSDGPSPVTAQARPDLENGAENGNSNENRSGDETSSTGADGPGFGLPAALGGVGLGAWLLRRRQRSNRRDRD